MPRRVPLPRPVDVRGHHARGNPHPKVRTHERANQSNQVQFVSHVHLPFLRGTTIVPTRHKVIRTVRYCNEKIQTPTCPERTEPLTYRTVSSAQRRGSQAYAMGGSSEADSTSSLDDQDNAMGGRAAPRLPPTMPPSHSRTTLVRQSLAHRATSMAPSVTTHLYPGPMSTERLATGRKPRGHPCAQTQGRPCVQGWPREHHPPVQCCAEGHLVPAFSAAPGARGMGRTPYPRGKGVGSRTGARPTPQKI